MASRQLINADKKAWYKEKKTILFVQLLFRKPNIKFKSYSTLDKIPKKGIINIKIKKLNIGIVYLLYNIFMRH